MSTLSSKTKPNYQTSDAWDVVWDRPYHNYETHHQAFWNLIKKNSSGKVLDLACGSASCWRDTDVKLTGIDFSSSALREAEKNYPKGHFLRSSIFDLPPVPGHFDTIVLSGVVNFYEDDKLFKLLKKVKLCTKKGTKIIVTINTIDDFPGRHWDVDTIRDRFGSLGKVTSRFVEPNVGFFVTIDVD